MVATRFRFLAILLVAMIFLPSKSYAQSSSDDFGDPGTFADSASDDPEQLIRQAEILIAQKRPIDARAKLQKALEKSPDDYRIHLMLGQYYLSEVGHFTLAYRYVRKAEELFMKKYEIADGAVDPEKIREQVMILYLRAESELNLDKYQDSLNTLDHLAKIFPPSELGWYMATRAWVLMKLKRLDEAVLAAQQGLLIDEDSKRVYNILGILLSLRGDRELSLKAFARAAASEMRLGSMGQAATPLNNAGEVYRELFRDSSAEASWIRALQMPDGCDHILPSLNTSILYIDQLRLLQADRALKDFESCYAAQSTRQDTEHRALLALSRGRIALHSGDFEKALDYLRDANEREQWFGKIGTNENDVRLAATIAMANALSAKVSVLRDTVRDHWAAGFDDLMQVPQLELRSWWLHRQARRMAVEELEDFEDLYMRNSDTMLEYPTLGSTLAGFPTVSLERRVNRLMETDPREPAHDQYRLYLAQNLLAHGKTDRALSLLNKLRQTLRPIDRLAKAEVLMLILKAGIEKSSWWSSESVQTKQETIRTKEELFALNPAAIRDADMSLPVTSEIRTTDGKSSKNLTRARSLLKRRLPEVEPELKDLSTYHLVVRESDGGKGISLELTNKTDHSVLASESGAISAKGEGYETLLNAFVGSVFHHRRDAAGEPVPKLELLGE